jgi:ribosome-associated translation inhibitor RaiA
MQTLPQITFHQIPPSEALEAQVRDRIADLERLFDGIVSCRVSIDGPHRHHQGGLFRVLIELGVPGHRIVVGRSSDDTAAHADAHVAVRDSFRAAHRQLDDYVRRRHGDVKSHAGPASR